MRPISFKRHRFPPAIIHHAIWLYARFTLSFRDVEELLAERGCTTSGCVRATSIDALQYGYHGIVPEECVGDRAEAPHLANLFDIGQKYCDVMPLREVLTWVDNYKPVSD
jgi:hypothetical protein